MKTVKVQMAKTAGNETGEVVMNEVDWEAMDPKPPLVKDKVAKAEVKEEKKVEHEAVHPHAHGKGK